MRAIFLAAGNGTRIRADIKENTKCLINVEGTSLLKKSIKKLVTSLCISEIIIVVGDNEEDIKSDIGYELNNIKVCYCVQKK